MIVRQLQTAQDSTRRINSTGWNSVRLLLTNDNMGFSFQITTIYEGAELDMHYQNHLESVYCMSGRGEIKNVTTGEVHPISPGTMYALDKHDKHILRGFEEMSMACVFNPPLIGNEVHNDSGAYELTAQTITD